MTNLFKFTLLLFFIVIVVSKIAPRERYFFDGLAFNNAESVFNYIDEGGYEKSTYRMEFAYEDFIKNLPLELLRYQNNLEILGVVRGDIKEVPAWVGKLGKLASVQFLDQEIKSLPQEIGDLKKLTHLKLGGNYLETLPKEIGGLTKLEVLLLQGNKLTSIPIEIGNLKNLRILDLSSNFLTTLPEEIKHLERLEYLYLGGNYLSNEEKDRIKKIIPNTNVFFN